MYPPVSVPFKGRLIYRFCPEKLPWHVQGVQVLSLDVSVTIEIIGFSSAKN